MERLSEGHIVKHKETGAQGVAVSDFMNCCSDTETPVVWNGEKAFEGTDTGLLEDLGAENAIPDPVKCGAGKGADCCIFLVAGPKGFECARYQSLRYSLIFRKDSMNAKREPVEAYPACMNQVDSNS